MKEILLWHWKEHPGMEITDAVKLLYQNEFGGGHMIKDEAASLLRLQEEAEKRRQAGTNTASQLSGTGIQKKSNLWEPVGNGLGRLSLDILKEGLRPETMNRMFVLTANAAKGTKEGFEQKLKLLEHCIEEKQPAFSPEEFREYCAAYKEQGYPAVSHSKAYHDACDPSYRIVGEEYWNFMEAFLAIDRLLLERADAVTVFIDGKSGSGKSTLGRLLEAVYGCGLIHMDDFFLQPFQRTEERFQEPGGNVDYERFSREVLPHLHSEEGFSYQIYDCRQQRLADLREVAPGRLKVVEGVYSHHPRFQDFCGLRIFLTVSEETQKERIRKRNGEVMLKRFLKEWIPLENRYFDACDIPKNSHICLDLSAPLFFR